VERVEAVMISVRLVCVNSTGSGSDGRPHVDGLQIDLRPVVFFLQLGALGIGSRLAIPQGAMVVRLVEIASGDNVDLHGSFVCCVYPSRSAAQSRSLMCQVVDWTSGAGKGKGRPSANALRLAADRAIMSLYC
jgi:hypothetical protein